MSSTPLAQILPIDNETPSSTPRFRPTSHRTPSFSCSDSSVESSPFLLNDASPPYSPVTPLNLIRIPFSWEQTPGIPKNHKKTEPSGRLLLLPPPPAVPAAAKKWRSKEEITPKKHLTRSKKDPFVAAMIKCSKDDKHDRGANIWNKGSLSDRFGFINIYTCKKTCAISESIAYVPRATTPHYLLHRHRRGPVA